MISINHDDNDDDDDDGVGDQLEDSCRELPKVQSKRVNIGMQSYKADLKLLFHFRSVLVY